MSKKLLKTSFYFTILSTLASAINFAFYPVISHILSASSFGDVQVGVSFIMLAASLLTSLSTLALFTSVHGHKERQTLNRIERLVISVSITCSAFTIVFAGPLATLLQLQNVSLLYILAFIFVINIPAATWIGALQGSGRFVASGWISIISATIKLLAACLFIKMGWGAFGALIGIALGSFTILPLAKILDKTKVIQYRKTFGIFRSEDMSFFLRRPDLLIILVSLVALAFIANVDVFIAKTVLSPTEAGSYAQLSTVAKIPYFAAVPISLVLFERFIRKNISEGLSFLAYSTIVVSIGIAVILCTNILLKTLFNYHGSSAEPLIPLTTAFTAYSVVVLAAYRLITQHRIKRLLTLTLLGIILTTSLVKLLGTTPMQIANTYAACISFTFLLSLVLTYTKKYE